ncbi:MAG: hypothetical protein Q8Q23_00170 [bacterium]|nr:hypothetical protein [bacterium]
MEQLNPKIEEPLIKIKNAGQINLLTELADDGYIGIDSETNFRVKERLIKDSDIWSGKDIDEIKKKVVDKYLIIKHEESGVEGKVA